jgi:putative DNA primase/helicase
MQSYSPQIVNATNDPPADAIPQAMRSERRWLVWKSEPTKVPYRADGKGKASCSSPETWCSFSEALAALATGKYTGLGFALGDNWAGVDLDDCLTEGGEIVWGEPIINRFTDTYAEISPSGRGVKIFGHGIKTSGSACSKNGQGPDGKGRLEVYDQGRWFAVTGRKWDGHPAAIADCTPQLADLCAEYLIKPSPAVAAPAGSRPVPRSRSVVSPMFRARCYVATLPPGISGQGGHNATFEAACTCFRFGLSEAEATEIMRDFNARCVPPWSDHDLQHKVESARQTVEADGEFGKLVIQDRPLPPRRAKLTVGDNLIESPVPMRLAEKYLDADQTDSEGRLQLVRSNQAWWRFAASRYLNWSDEELNASIRRRLDSLKTPKRNKEGDPTGIIAPLIPTCNLVREVREAIPACGTLATIEMPGWLDRRASPRREDIIAFRNGLLDFGAYRVGEINLIPSTPEWFSTVAAPYDFDPDAKCPGWKKFLHQVFDGDEERHDLLQEFFGLLLVADNSLEKFLMLQGPPGSGKGTALTVLNAMLGADQIAITTFAKLAGRFGLATMIGKLCAMLPDAHVGQSTDAKAALEVLKSIVGNDPQAIDRKNIDELARVQLLVRFIIAVNDLPKLPDDAGSLKRRLLLIHFPKSFQEAPDINLKSRLAAEAPGVANWALQGLCRLRERGAFTEPASSRAVIEEFERVLSPVKSFLAERCEVDPSSFIEKSLLYESWAVWCKSRRDEPGNLSHFGLSLVNADVRISAGRRGPRGSQFNVYNGVKLCD